jgi:hypothetical protein
MRLAIYFVFVFCLASLAFAENSKVIIKEGEPPTQAEIDETNREIKDRDQPSEVSSHPCPYGCNKAGFSLKNCKEWKEKGTCFIGPNTASK